jgi:hypothetical protein
MTAVLLIGGIGLLLVGFVAISFGIPVKEFSFGHTLILTGAIVACTGIMMLGLWSVVRELRKTARLLLGPALRKTSLLLPERLDAESESRGPEDGDLLFSRDQLGAMANAESAAQSPTQSALWPDEVAQRDDGRSDPHRQEQAEAASVVKPRRNLLFSSTSRKERERAQARMSEPSPDDPSPGTSGLRSRAAREANVPPASFEDSWSDRGRSGDAARPRRGTRSASTFTEPDAGPPEADRHSAGSRDESQPPVTVLKSGVVDGMAYSLYSDGSIEAQMPEGMMRFASIDELRAHLDQRP